MKFRLSLFILMLGAFSSRAQISINSTGEAPAAGAMLDVSSTNMGFLPPRLTTAQRDGIVNPPEGLTIYNSDIRCLEYYRGAPDGWYSACPTVASLTTNSISDVTGTTAVCGGNVTTDGGSSVSVRGVCWSTSPNPTIADFTSSDGNGIGSFSSSLTGLSLGTLYYVRAYATNGVGTAYGNEFSFTTLNVPSLSTDVISDITSSTATGGGSVSDNGGDAVTARGVCWGTSPNPTLSNDFTTDGSGNGTFVSSLTGLSQSTTYYVRAYATNGVGTGYGDEVSFTTSTLLYFTNSGLNQWTVPDGVTSVAMTVVGGGGSGGGDVGGGGGGGQVVNIPSYAVSPGQVLSITVAAQTDYPQTYAHYGRDGEATVVSGGTGGTVTALGGNGGRGRSQGGPGNNVGWNGGGGSYDYNGGNPGNGGYPGGNAYPGRSAGGGGGSGGSGGNATVDGGGTGGAGVQSIIDGIYYGGGGGGGQYQGSIQAMGTHGGGNGGVMGGPYGADAEPNRGGGGGGGPSTGNNPNAGRGGSGVVIIAYGQ